METNQEIDVEVIDMLLATARAEAIPKLSLYALPFASTCRSPGDS